MQTCITCKRTLPKSDFHFDKTNNRHRSYCKICDHARVKAHQHRRKQEAINYKGGACQICGYKKYQGALDFHHIDPSQKDFTLATYSVYNLERIKKELDKCILVCSNCHREIHGGVTKVSVVGS